MPLLVDYPRTWIICYYCYWSLLLIVIASIIRIITIEIIIIIDYWLQLFVLLPLRLVRITTNLQVCVLVCVSVD